MKEGYPIYTMPPGPDTEPFVLTLDGVNLSAMNTLVVENRMGMRALIEVGLEEGRLTVTLSPNP